jgi:hypothetical protein
MFKTVGTRGHAPRVKWETPDSQLTISRLSGAILFRGGFSPHNTSLAASSCLEVRILPMLGGDLYEIAFCIDYRGFVVSVPSEPRACHYLNSRRLHRLYETINVIA